MYTHYSFPVTIGRHPFGKSMKVVNPMNKLFKNTINKFQSYL